MTAWLAREEIGGAVLYQGDMRLDVFIAASGQRHQLTNVPLTVMVSWHAGKIQLCGTAKPTMSIGARQSRVTPFWGRGFSMSGRSRMLSGMPVTRVVGTGSWRTRYCPGAMTAKRGSWVHSSLRSPCHAQNQLSYPNQRSICRKSRGENALPLRPAWQPIHSPFFASSSRKGAPVRSRYYMKNQEYTSFFWRGRARELNYGGAKQSFKCNRPSLDWHVTAKPFALMALYVLQSSNPGDLVLDPFIGSAPTIMAALAFGRRAIGVELEAEYFDKACARVEVAHQAGFAQEIAEWEAARVANGLKGLANAA